jgi:Cft2 family RNA processing exonuclease
MGTNTLNYEVIQSGSKGNCVVIHDVMVDCGVSFAKLKEHLYNIRYLLLTHIHSDHIRPATLQKIKVLFPKILIIGNYEVAQVYGVHVISNAGYPVETEHYNFMPFECVHNVVTQGFTWTINGLSIIYATDTNTLKHAPLGMYDYFFLESNHDEKKLLAARRNFKGGYDPYTSGKRHLSTKACKTFYYLNRRARESELIELHKSERFY